MRQNVGRRMTKLFYRSHSRPTAVKAVTLAVILLCAVDGQVADRAVRDFGPGVTDMAELAAHRAQDRIEPIIVRGGITVERSRHTIVGGVIGCAAGVAAGATVIAGLGFLTGGAAFAGVSLASAIGCSVGGFGGAAIGYPLDAYAWE